ncbi:unnamed protein product [Ectocarpus sp. 8 AP-2014]
MAWPHLDKAFSFLYGGPSAETKKKDKTVRSPVVHVKAAAPSDPLEEAFAAAAAETLKEFNASDSEEDGGTALVSQEDAGKSFIALQLPTTRSINEHMANEIFDVLERGSELLEGLSLLGVGLVVTTVGHGRFVRVGLGYA